MLAPGLVPADTIRKDVASLEMYTLRGISRTCDERELVQRLREMGFQTPDFWYLPPAPHPPTGRSRGNKCKRDMNKGYCFISYSDGRFPGEVLAGSSMRELEVHKTTVSLDNLVPWLLFCYGLPLLNYGMSFGLGFERHPIGTAQRSTPHTFCLVFEMNFFDEMRSRSSRAAQVNNVEVWQSAPDERHVPVPTRLLHSPRAETSDRSVFYL